MAELPVLRDQQVRQTPRGPALPRATEDAFGAQMGRAARSLQRGLDDVAVTADNIDQRLDAANARELAVEMANFERYTLDEAEHGYLNQQGRNALERRAEVEQALRAKVTEIGERARSERARAAFSELAGRRMEAALERVTRHSAAQLVVYEDSVSEAAMREAHDSAILLRHDPEQVQVHIDTISRHAEAMANRRGLGAEGVRRAMEERTSTARADVIIALADDDPSLANDLFENWRGGMTAGDQMRVNEATRAVRLAEQARQTVDALLTEHNGDFRAAYAAAEAIENTVQRDEVIARLANQAAMRETIEARDTDNAEERARANWPNVSAADRALLVREGRWNELIRDFRSAQRESGDNPTTSFLLRLSVDNPQAFNVVMRVMRDQPLPNGMQESELDAMLSGATGAGIEEWRRRGQAMAADDYVGLVETHEMVQGNRPSGSDGLTLVQRSYRDVWAVAQMRANQLGLGTSTAVSVPNERQRTQQLQGFIQSRTSEFVRRYNRAPQEAEMQAIVDEAFAQRTERGWFSGEERPRGRYAFEATEGTRSPTGNVSEVTVTIRYRDIPTAARTRLLRAWQQANPGAATDNEAAVQAVEEAYAAELRRY